MAINYNNDPYNQGLGNLDIGNMQTAGLLPEFMGGTSDAEDAAQNSLEQIQDLRRQENTIKSLGEGAQHIKQDELKSIQNKIQEIKNENKDSQEFKDIGGLTASANNIMSDANYGYYGVPELSSGIMQMLNKQQNYEPQYRIRDQLNRDFLQGGLFRDAKQGLGDTYNQLRQSPLGQGIGSIKNFATSIKDKGIDLGKMALSGIGNVIMPGLGYVLNAARRPDYPSDAMSRSFAFGNKNAGTNYGYYDQLRHGNVTGQDQFGINTVSQFGNYPGYYDQYAQDYRAGKYSPTSKFAANKYAHAQKVAAANQARIEKDFFTNDDSDGGGEVTYTSPAPTYGPYSGGGGGGGGGGGYNEGDGGSYSGAGEDSDWGGGEKDGGFIDGTNRRYFKNGGIASL